MVASSARSLRSYSKKYHGTTFKQVRGHHENALFADCVLQNVAGATLKDCVLRGTHFDINSAKDAQGLTLTLNCDSFNHVELSEYLFDLYLVLLLKTKGNTEKRRKLIELIGKDKVYKILKELEQS